MKIDILKNLKFVVKKHTPEMLIGAGVAGGVASTVLACKATLKAVDILEDSKANLEAIHTVRDDENFADQYTEEDYRKDLTIYYVQTGAKLAKVYAPAIILGVASVACILGGTNIFKKRNAALAAAYAVVDGAFNDYRDRVREKYGEEAEDELHYGLKAIEVTEEHEDEKGKKKKVKKTIKTTDKKEYSPYARLFSDGNPRWEKSSLMNVEFLSKAQEFANMKLRNDGFLLLKDVYDYLGYGVTEEACVVGWKYKEGNEDGDNYVDFGFMKDEAFMSYQDPSVVLDFNVDGVIIHDISSLDRRWVVW